MKSKVKNISDSQTLILLTFYEGRKKSKKDGKLYRSKNHL